MKKFILIAISVISAALFANVNTRKILEEYRKEALMEQSKTVREAKIKEKPAKKSNPKVTKSVDEDDVTANEIIENTTNDKHAYDDVIEKVNIYLQNNPEKKEKLEKHYKTVIGHE